MMNGIVVGPRRAAGLPSLVAVKGALKLRQRLCPSALAGEIDRLTLPSQRLVKSSQLSLRHRTNPQADFVDATGSEVAVGR